ncbi:MAG: DUF4919 domain-containing protein [Cyclobacteriaceae bacterium]|nr:DUF4919 domain-containing protein [Cyclobacteriaceae bacterium]
MKKIAAIIAITIISSSILFAQVTFNYHKDFKRILEQSKDKSSEFYYPKLLERFNRNDSTLTDLEVLALQIGFTANSNYKPYQTVSIEREIKDLVWKEKYEEALIECNKFLKTNPLNFTALMEKGFAYMKLGKEGSELQKERFMIVLHSILASGEGTKDSPFFVLSPIDGQTLITHIFGESIGIMGSGTDANGNFLDILEMKKEDGSSKTLYFNINHAAEKMFSESDMKKINKASKKNKK